MQLRVIIVICPLDNVSYHVSVPLSSNSKHDSTQRFCQKPSLAVAEIVLSQNLVTEEVYITLKTNADLPFSLEDLNISLTYSGVCLE